MATIICPACSAQYRISDEKISEKSRLRCKKCGTVFRLHDTIKQADEFSPDHEAPPRQPSLSEPVQPPSEAHTLEFDLASIQFHTPSSVQETETPPVQEDLSVDMNLGDMALDFGIPSRVDSEGETLSFGPLIPADEETPLGGEELHDHIAEISIEQPEMNLSGFSFGEDDQQGKPDDNLDFSFSANIPEGSGEEGEEVAKGEEEFTDESLEEPQVSSTDQDLGGDLNLGLPEEEIAASAVEAQKLPISSEAEVRPEALEQPQPEEVLPEESLKTCCIDSLAMGLLRCEICGRNLKDKHQYAHELQQQRRQQLREELVKAEVQIGFSEE
ncbi:hypothetical protein U27_04175 [Candidatus Vecturithrix granuli]|uniref:Zinc finger/thioredoxin putative domain-containing protein n=1 Tax=Vecturithrix granuli TaxID=1499967 RepID=A0A081BY05_VECG1|nr:hypothetical protein U27_04175 [Candidatus Vecturithrix granuli]